MAQRAERLPNSAGSGAASSRRWLAILGVLVGVGVLAFAYTMVQGHVVTSLRDVGPMNGAPWGLYITLLIYFVGISFAGISTAAVVRLANIKALKPVARMAELLTIVTLVMAAILIMADLGNPLRGLKNLLLYARPGSPFFGTFTLVISGYFAASVVYFYLDARRDTAVLATTPGKYQGLYRRMAAGYSDTPAEQRRHRTASFWLAIAILPLLVVANATLGFVFGLQVGRPGWYSALQAPTFLMMAGISGLGVLIAMAAGYRRSLGDEVITPNVFRWLGAILLGLLVAYGYFTIVELLTVTYAAGFKETEVWQAILTGQYAWMYWGSILFLVIGLVLSLAFVTKRVGVKALVWAAVLVNIAAVGKRFVIVVPSQTVGTLLPYGQGSYWPNFVEIALAVGVCAFGVLLYYGVSKIIPLIALPEGPLPAQGATIQEEVAS